MRPRLTHEEIAERTAEVVNDIPAGCVMTYGDIAALVGTVARHVGRTLASGDLDVPWWRVVNARGTLPEHLQGEALARYREEGTPVRDGHADLRRCRWWPDDDGDGTASSMGDTEPSMEA